MELPGGPPSRPRSQRSSSPPWPARDHRRHLLRAQEWLRLAAPAARLPSLEDGLPLLPFLAPGRHLGEDALSPARARAGSPGEEPPAERRDSRQPVGQDDGRGRRGTRLLSRGQEGQGKKAPSASRHAGLGAHRQGPQGERHRSRRHQAAARAREDRLPQAPLPSVAGRLSTPVRRTEAPVGSRRPWDGRQRSCATLGSWLRRR
jgi:hypothetical protein